MSGGNDACLVVLSWHMVGPQQGVNYVPSILVTQRVVSKSHQNVCLWGVGADDKVYFPLQIESTSRDILAQVKTSPDSSPKSRFIGFTGIIQIPLIEARGKADLRSWRIKEGCWLFALYPDL